MANARSGDDSLGQIITSWIKIQKYARKYIAIVSCVKPYFSIFWIWIQFFWDRRIKAETEKRASVKKIGSSRLKIWIRRAGSLVGANAEGVLIDLLVEFKLRELDRPFGQEGSIYGVN
jgi:hypothetical protein